MATKKPAVEDSDHSEPVGEESTVITHGVSEADTVKEFLGIYNSNEPHYTIAMIGALSSLHSLQKSGVITYADGNEWTPIWRTGHLEHIANLYAGDPATTERNYADDLAVARAYSAETWERLTNG